MFGREPRLSINVALGVNHVHSGSKSYPAYIASLRDRLRFGYEKVMEGAKMSAAPNKGL